MMRLSLWPIPRISATERHACHLEERLRPLPREQEERAYGGNATQHYHRDPFLPNLLPRRRKRAGARPRCRTAVGRRRPRTRRADAPGETTHPCAEVWDRTRLVCTVRKEGPAV